MPNKYGIWKMHPPKLRVYGWFPAPRTLVVVGGALELETKADKNLNRCRMGEVRNFIRTYGLDKYVVRGDICAIFP